MRINPPSASNNDTYTIHTSLLFSPHTLSFHKSISLTVSTTTGLITKVTTRSDSADLTLHPGDLDLRGLTVLPGFVDAHTHIFIHAYTEASSRYQERDESLVERILRATNHARAALKAGYTTYRDLGTEGLQDADVGFRDSINRGIIPGPRMFVATDPLASSGSYAIRYESRLNGTVVPRLSDACDGVDGVMAGVRRRIAAGADFIKFYSGYRRRTLRYPPPAYPGGPDVLHPPRDRNPNSTMWSQAEMDAIVVEAKRAHAPVAAHAIEPEGAIMAAKAGVTTIEHLYHRDDEALSEMKKNNVIFVPTLAILEAEKGSIEIGEELFKGALEHTKAAYDAGIKLACGGDTGAFNHGENAREMELMVKAGVPVIDVLRATTLGGYEACGGELTGQKFGALEVGWSADLVAVQGNPVDDLIAIRVVKWVLKDGRVMVQEGHIVD